MRKTCQYSESNLQLQVNINVGIKEKIVTKLFLRKKSHLQRSRNRFLVYIWKYTVPLFYTSIFFFLRLQMYRVIVYSCIIFFLNLRMYRSIYYTCLLFKLHLETYRTVHYTCMLFDLHLPMYQIRKCLLSGSIEEVYYSSVGSILGSQSPQ